MLEDSTWITLHFHLPGFQNLTRRLTQTTTTDEGFSFSFHKNYRRGPTYPRLTLILFAPNYIKWARRLWELKQVLDTNLIPMRTKFDTQTKRVPA